MAFRQTYDFRCQVCGTLEEKKCTVSEYQKQSQKQTLCPKCGGVMLRTFLQAPQVSFKGDGWPDKKGGSDE